ncbi:KTSC domain-containing protein [Bacillus altitudinis]|uniref:KTSC domain-containing protein n=1 Tax=Bacillus altitudinis TaxID=293387 RepID=UPI003D783F19
MNLIPVNSSNLNAVGYDLHSQILRIAFRNGTYDYYGVPESVYNGLMSAASLGKYHDRFIKNSYNFARV